VTAYSAAQLTNEWLGEVLADAGYPGAHVTGFTTAPVGTGQAALSFRIAIEGTADVPLPPSIVAKFPSDDETSRKTAAMGGTYRREVEFYEALQAQVTIRTPPCYFADIGDDGVDFVLLLADLAPAAQGDQIEGCDAELARVALRELAGLHGPTWREPAADDRPAGSAAPTDRGQILLQVYRGGLGPFMERCSIGFAPDELAFLERLGAQESYPHLADDRSFCVVHNDYRLDNFLYEPGRVAETLHVVDWQTYGVGNPMTDVAYFLGGCLQPAVRKDQERHLVAGYHHLLVESGVTGYDFDDCWADYQVGAYHGLMFAMAAMVHVTQSDRGDELFRVMAQRHIRQVLETGAEDLLT
jgi:hypothetical protein